MMPVEAGPPHQPTGNKRAYVDLGVVNLVTAWVEGDEKAAIYSGRPLLADWWYWTGKIAEYQSRLKRVSGRHVSRRLRRLYRRRRRRFRHVVKTLVHRFVKSCWEKGVAEIVLGDLTGIRENNSKSRKTNAMVHNFWSFRYIVGGLRRIAENFGVRVRLVDESGTSSRCPRCAEAREIRRRKRLLKCLRCGLEAHRDAVGAVKIGLAQGAQPPAGSLTGRWHALCS